MRSEDKASWRRPDGEREGVLPTYFIALFTRYQRLLGSLFQEDGIHGRFPVYTRERAKAGKGLADYAGKRHGVRPTICTVVVINESKASKCRHVRCQPWSSTSSSFHDNEHGKHGTRYGDGRYANKKLSCSKYDVTSTA
ncbi:hypothetical protein ACROYT_G042961 [Oculina patagonica]